MVFLRGEETARNWEREEAGGRSVFPLGQAVRFAAQYFRPLLQG